MDSNHRRRKPADLQSAPFGHSGICPFKLFCECKSNTYFFNDQEKSIIFIAVIANSSPFRPTVPSIRSMA